MKITPKFDVGDKVFVAQAVRQNRQVQCPECLGAAKWDITTPAGTKMVTRCPVCNRGWESSGTINALSVDAVVTPLTVGSVRTDTDSNRKDRRVEYMMEETGVGSGTLWRESVVFASPEEAMVHARELVEREVAQMTDEQRALIGRSAEEAVTHAKRVDK